jgi:hypothetical protein
LAVKIELKEFSQNLKVFPFKINACPFDYSLQTICKNNCVFCTVCEHLCTEPSESDWRCACLGKVAKVAVTVGAIYEEWWCTGGSGRDDGGCGNMKCIQKLLESNTRQTACLWIECKSLMERELVYCSIGGALLGGDQLCGITAQ